MKKILLLIVNMIIILTFSSCSQSRNISSFKIVTACFAEKTTDGVKYSFYVSQPPGGSEENGSGSEKAKLLSVYAQDFKGALGKFEESFGRYELSHMSAFFTDAGYLSEHYYNDRKSILEYVKVSPLIKMFVIGQTGSSVAECIGKSYDYSPKSFVESTWSGSRKKLLCTMSEIVFASENPLYTASVPVVEIFDESKTLVSDAIVFYNVGYGVMAMTDDDFKLFSEHLKTYGKTSKSLSLSLGKDGINVEFKEGIKHRADMVRLSEKYTSLGFDILNIFYYSKKLFPDYISYYAFIENKDNTFIKFEAE